MCSIIIRWMLVFERRRWQVQWKRELRIKRIEEVGVARMSRSWRAARVLAIAPSRSRTLLEQKRLRSTPVEYFNLSERKALGVSFLPQRRAGPPRFECPRDLLSLIVPWLLADLRSLHLSSHVCSETHSRWRFPRR